MLIIIALGVVYIDKKSEKRSWTALATIIASIITAIASIFGTLWVAPSEYQNLYRDLKEEQGQLVSSYVILKEENAALKKQIDNKTAPADATASPITSAGVSITVAPATTAAIPKEVSLLKLHKVNYGSMWPSNRTGSPKDSFGRTYTLTNPYIRISCGTSAWAEFFNENGYKRIKGKLIACEDMVQSTSANIQFSVSSDESNENYRSIYLSPDITRKTDLIEFDVPLGNDAKFIKISTRGTGNGGRLLIMDLIVY